MNKANKTLITIIGLGVVMFGAYYLIAIRPVSLIKEAVMENLFDPSSARFRNIRSIYPYGNSYKVYCGEVNSKNRMGGYVGFKPFMVFGEKRQVIFDESLGTLKPCLN